MTEEFSAEFNSATTKDWGSSEITLLEFSTLRTLYKQIIGNRSLASISPEDRDIVRDTVVKEIVENGWPKNDSVSKSDLSEAAVKHACCVAEVLFEERGIEAAPATFLSYTTKDQFDRFSEMLLRRSGKLNKGSSLFDDWFGPQDRQQGYISDRVHYPAQIDGTKIYGVAKPNRYFPAQLMRYLEFIRLGRITNDADKVKLGISLYSPEELKKLFSIPWIEFKEIITGSDSVDDYTVGTAVKVMEVLKERNLSSESIASIILAGFDPKGPLSEHGNIPQVTEIWIKLLEQVKQKNKIQDIFPVLQEKYKQRIG